MNREIRMNTLPSKWTAFLVVVLILTLFIISKCYEIWTWSWKTDSSEDITRLPKVRDFYYKWIDNLNKAKGGVYYQEIIPKGKAKLDILLLHGMRFTSADWVELHTLDVLASHGYHVIALDLPGHGKSSYKLPKLDRSQVAEFLEQFITKARLNSPVIVSPSASGIYSLAYIAASKPAKGFVAIAPVGTDKIPVRDFQYFPPTLIIRGSKDKNLGVTSTNQLRQYVPHKLVEVIEGAGHACYLEKPEQFHAILLNFLQAIVNKSFHKLISH